VPVLNPAKSCCYPLPVHSDLCENSVWCQPWCYWRGLPTPAPRVNTLVRNLREAKKLKKLSFSLGINPQGKRHTIRKLWEACTDTIHATDKEKVQKAHQKTNPPKSQNTSAFGKIKQWLP